MAAEAGPSTEGLHIAAASSLPGGTLEPIRSGSLVLGGYPPNGEKQIRGMQSRHAFRMQRYGF